jgi:hypothetical protein
MKCPVLFPAVFGIFPAVFAGSGWECNSGEGRFACYTCIKGGGGEETNAESEETWSILCTLDETNVKDDEETIFSLVLRTAFFKGVSLRRRAASVWRQKTHKWRRGEIVSQPSTVNHQHYLSNFSQTRSLCPTMACYIDLYPTGTDEKNLGSRNSVLA